MTRCLNVTIGIEVDENDVREYVKGYGGDPDSLEDNDWIEYAEFKYNRGLGASATIC